MKNRSLFISLLVILAFFIEAFVQTTATQANTTITVVTIDDELNVDGDCSLREAIRAANTNSPVDACPAGSGADIIILPSGSYTLTITGSGENAGLTGDLDITDDLTINGSDADDTIIDGNGSILNDRVFHIIGLITVNISDVTIRDGNAGPGDGGGIFNSDGTLTLSNSIISNNTANGTYGGGGIYNNRTLTLDDVTIVDNITASDGGGIRNYLNGALTLNNTTISGNTANGLFGGGVYNNGTVVLHGSTITGNSAFRGGGLNSSGTLTVSSSTFTGNSSSFGGGVFNDGDAILNTVTFSNNTGGNGSAVNNDGKMTLTEATIFGNTADGNIFNTGELILANSTVFNNTNYTIVSASGTMTITNSSIVSNTIGVGISNGSSSTVRLTNCTINDNVGGGVFNGGTLIIENSTASGNSASGWVYAGGIASSGTLTVINSTISGNSATENGGGIKIHGGTASLNNVTITNNTADSDSDGTGDGGGLFNSDGTVTVRNTIIGGNTDPGEQANDCSGPLNSQDYNLIQDIKGCTITGITSHNLTEVNPGLSPLQDNGGPTLTHALVADSPAIDASNPAGCIDHQGHTLGFDQRGFFRIVDGDSNGSAICDMGAYEFGSTAPSYFIYLPIIEKFVRIGYGRE